MQPPSIRKGGYAQEAHFSADRDRALHFGGQELGSSTSMYDHDVLRLCFRPRSIRRMLPHTGGAHSLRGTCEAVDFNGPVVQYRRVDLPSSATNRSILRCTGSVSQNFKSLPPFWLEDAYTLPFHSAIFAPKPVAGGSGGSAANVVMPLLEPLT
ncbi:hypothetical protein BAUCODRAFT_423040 [Baudoinia panamericana UAMH 10762]|uniref:Uncharacterized protein n=1 Tax=Baudoinia panamericana (strain UAMH 10762) TaxID=717646 RepID=M2N339_BAUPA|nr:uncharacterized protein BAUCODRAFT_423040 [Baudoinia panamericana UAMH 10762]EMC98373.1 hypothetical protein BAUCODRAFT_423040 [Baudoinia panamericana UAMH 10762]